MRRLLLVVFAFALLVVSCDSQDLMAKLQSQQAPVVQRHELTQVDIFDIPDIHGDQIEVFGVGLGDSKERVLAKLGEPDKLLEFPDIDTFNFQYGERLNMTTPGLVVQVRNGTVSKITIKQPFNQYLKGKTLLDHTKDDVYFKLWGVPDRQEELDLIRIFYYEDEGFEVFIKKGLLNGFSLVAPQPVKSPKRKLDQATIDALETKESTTASGKPTEVSG